MIEQHRNLASMHQTHLSSAKYIIISIIPSNTATNLFLTDIAGRNLGSPVTFLPTMVVLKPTMPETNDSDTSEMLPRAHADSHIHLGLPQEGIKAAAAACS